MDVGAQLDQFVAQRFHLGLDRVHQHALALQPPNPREFASFLIPERSIGGWGGTYVLNARKIEGDDTSTRNRSERYA